jgi:sugar phosphate isomerase/epimerase
MVFKIGCLDYTFSYVPFHQSMRIQSEILFSGLSKLHIIKYHHYLEKSLSLISSLGFEGVQIMCNHPDQVPLNPKNLNKKCGELGLEITSIGGYQNLLGNSWERLKKSIDYAAEANVKIVCTHSGNGNWPLLEERLNDLCNYAFSRGCVIAIENSPLHLVKTTDDLMKLKRMVKKIRFNLDPANLVSAGCEPVNAVNGLKKSIVHTHAKDCIENRLVFTSLGKGDVNFQSYLKALKKIGYNGYLVLEYEGRGMPLKETKTGKLFLENCIASIG